MTAELCTLTLAEGMSWETLLPLLLLLLLGLLGKIFSKVKEKSEQQARESQQQQRRREYGPRQADQRPPQRPQPAAGRPAPPRRRTPMEETIAALRSVFTGQVEEAEEPQAAQPPRAVRPPRRPRPAPSQPEGLGEGVRREVSRLEQETQAVGIGVRQEVSRMEEQLKAEQLQQRRRMGLGAAAGGIGLDPRRLRVNLRQPRAALTAIVYHEILGLPKGLRQGPEPWER